MSEVTIGRALLSVSDKSGLIELGQALAARGVDLVSTGGTAKALREAGLAVRDISELTGFPEMMDGRVKTLHPKVHGGLLAVRDNAEHAAAMAEHDIGAIDLVVVNLYPFEATVARGAARDDVIENIDIGGPSMVRSAAKNHEFVAIVTDPADYAGLMAELDATRGATTLAFRRKLAAKADANAGPGLAHRVLEEPWLGGGHADAQLLARLDVLQRRCALRPGRPGHGDDARCCQ